MPFLPDTNEHDTKAEKITNKHIVVCMDVMSQSPQTAEPHESQPTTHHTTNAASDGKAVGSLTQSTNGKTQELVDASWSRGDPIPAVPRCRAVL